jgi:hypothetical protein
VGEASAGLESSDHAEGSGQQDQCEPGGAYLGGVLNGRHACAPDGHHYTQAGKVPGQQTAAACQLGPRGLVHAACSRASGAACATAATWTPRLRYASWARAWAMVAVCPVVIR